MRKLILEIEPSEKAREGFMTTFKHIHSYEVLETLKIDYEEGICIDLIECLLKEGLSIHDMKYIGNMEILSVLKSVGNKHTCLIKYYQPEDSKELFKEADIDLIYTTPSLISNKKIIVSVIGDQKALTKFIELVKTHAGKIENMIFKRAAYQKHDILSVLTDKQKEVLVAAHKFGYYDYPKKINSKQLSEKVKISKPTMVQHLRKAEGRILGEIMAGYSP